MKIAQIDYVLARFCQSTPWLMRWIGGQESSWLEATLATVAIERPVYVCGLARSGSTMLLELFSQLEGVATHRYRDFPFISIPILWNKYLDRISVSALPVERPHRDRIKITRESPEAMEEPLWITWFPDLASSMSPVNTRPQFDRFVNFYQAHIRKMLVVRNGQRYVAKNNYHATRIEVLTQIFSDAEFIVPIRHPISHVDSLVRQHRLFSMYAREDSRVAHYMAAAGHFEFGPQRMPIGQTVAERKEIYQAWSTGNDWLGYALQWRNVYGSLKEIIEHSPQLAKKIHICRYEDFCESPQQRFGELLSLTGFDSSSTQMPALDHISQSGIDAQLVPSDVRKTIWDSVKAVAEGYGYEYAG